ncbi:MAG: phosphotransferase family protein [Aeromicrobium sp.]|uniref:phosphotransferase family protein n=1 Tax=Aeromicrobium sp. TaxID=1871063 RepID=UPI002602C955|nr:phosphotransferase family protein [Aeromicrobium sp.]MDF1705950.1 phosphotransferase family protein [Aeromicrobium sp.]
MTPGRDTTAEEPHQIAELFRRFLLDRGHAAQVDQVRMLSGGRSVLTMHLELNSTDPAVPAHVVLQVQKEAGPTAGVADVRRQFELLGLARSRGLPVATPLWCSTDRRPLGAPFLTTSLVAGVALDPFRRDDGPLLDDLASNAGLRAAIVEHLVALHSITASDLPDSARLPSAITPVTHEIDRWADAISGSRFADDPVLSYAELWLRQNEPRVQRRSLIHGDYRLGNFVLGDRDIAAILDWEFAGEGDPLLDVAMLSSPTVLVGGRYDGLWQEGEFARLYADRAGIEISADTLRYYVVLAVFKVAGLWVNSTHTAGDGAMSLDLLRAGFSVLTLRRTLGEVLGLASPARDAFAPSIQAASAALKLPDASRDAVLLMSVARALVQRPPFEQELDFWTHYATWVGSTGHVAPVDLTQVTARLLAAASGDPGARDLLAQAAELPFTMWP